MAINDHVIHMENGILHSDSPRLKIDMMVSKALAHQATGPLIIHFHGGLVSFTSAHALASRLLPIYQKAEGFPIFFLWESGLLETIKNNLFDVSKEEIFRIIWKRIRKTIERKLMQFLGSRDLGDLPQPTDSDFEAEIDDALTAGDVTELMQKDLEDKERLVELSPDEHNLLQAELEFDFELLTEVQNISNALRDPNEVEDELNARSFTVRGSTSTLMDPVALNKFVERPDPASRGLISAAMMINAIVKITAKVISRFVHGRDHGLHATIVEEILRALYVGNVGGLIWKTMKKDTADSFGPDSQVHGGTAFLDSLKSQADLNKPPRILLIGHSTGAIYISQFLKHADNVLPPNFKFDLVYLAPASTFRLTSKTFENFKNRISEFRMFTMTDENEKKDRLVPIIYPHSLLYFVSGVLEPEVDMPIMGMERFYNSQKFHLSKFPAVSGVRDYIDSIPNSAVWSVTINGGDGLNSGAITHGDFDNDQTTLASISHIIKNAF